MVDSAKMVLRQDYATIEDEGIFDELSRKKLSASMITSFEGCHARWLGETFVTRDILEQDLDTAASRGSLFHRVMEIFFGLPPTERETSVIKKCLGQALKETDRNGVRTFGHFSSNREALQWVLDSARKYYQMGENPKDVEIATITQKGREQQGLETFVGGKVADTEREMVGFVDRVSVSSDGDGVIVEDWKTGKMKSWKGSLEKNKDGESAEGFAEQRQQKIYAMLLQNEGNNVSGARLIYPSAQTFVDVDLNDIELESRVVDDVLTADKTLSELEDSNQFAYKPSFLCAWCPLVKMCPQSPFNRPGGQKRLRGKVLDSYNQQPGIDVLFPHISSY